MTASLRIWQLRTLVNPLIVGRFAGAEGVAFVGLAIRVAESLGALRLAAGRLAIAGLARLQNDSPSFRSALAQAVRIQVIALGALLSAFTLAAPWTIRHVIGMRWTASLLVFPFVAVGVLVSSVYNLQASALFVVGRHWIVTRAFSVHVLLLASVSAPLVPRAGIAGYGWAELIACAGYFLIESAETKSWSVSLWQFAPTLGLFCVILLAPLGRSLAKARAQAAPPGAVRAASAQNTIPATFFGLHFRRDKIAWPRLPFGALRLWDTDTRWHNLNPHPNVYRFAVLDDYLRAARQNGVDDVLLTLGSTPAWASSRPDYDGCDFARVALGDCAPPADLNADGTGANQYWRDFVFQLGTHLAGLRKNEYAPVRYLTVWNEFTRGTEAPASWTGTPQQLLRMTQDANCILTARGTLTFSHEACTASAVHEPQIGMLPDLRLTNPDAVPIGRDLSTLQVYLGQRGAQNVTDVLAVHAYTYGGGGAVVEAGATGLPQEWTNLAELRARTAGAPIWSTEGSWGNTHANLPDSDMQKAFLARYYLMGWSLGFERLYWYAADNSWGRLIYPSGIEGCRDYGTREGCFSPAAIAWTQVFGWMAGNRMTSACAADGSLWTCGLTRPDGTQTLAVWDAAQSCAHSRCTTREYGFKGNYKKYFVLDGPDAAPILGKTVTIGIKPILLSE